MHVEKECGVFLGDAHGCIILRLCFYMAAAVCVYTCRTNGLHSLDEFCKVEIVHSSGIFDNPVKTAHIINIICKAALYEVIAINTFTKADKFRFV